MRRLLREIDIPPLWLALFAAVGWGIAQVFPLGMPGGFHVGAALIVLGLVLTGLAGAQMLWCRTSPIPRRLPKAMVRRGAFSLSRNPIYLADVLMLTGWLLCWKGVWALPLVAVFMWVITRRYVLPEERVLAVLFAEEFDSYRKKVRRWL